MLKTNISLVKKNDSWLPKKEQLQPAIEKHGYTLLKTLGEGAYAKVKLANSKKHNGQVAVKVINKRRAPKDFLKKFLPREVHLMHRLDHPNVIKLYEVVETSTKVYIILQLASKGDLLEHINNKCMLSEDEARVLFCQLAAAMAYCHKEQVVHRDLKCENILIDGEGKLCVTDFGFAINTVKNRLLETYCGSYAYCCPQILRGEPYDGTKADVWSMGAVLYAMTCARLPFSDDDLRDLIKGALKHKLKFTKTVSKECRELVRAMLNANQDERYSAEQVFRSPWCMKALKKHPELCYLDELLRPPNERRSSSERFTPQEEEFEEEVFPTEVKRVHPKIGANSKMASIFSFQSPKQPDALSRRHTISGFEINEDGSHRLSLRNDLLRSLAEKDIQTKSVQNIDKERKAAPDDGAYKQHARRRSTLVTDVVKVMHTNEKCHGERERRASLVSDVIKFDPQACSAGRRNSMSCNQASITNIQIPAKNKAEKKPHLPGGPKSREKEIAKLRYTSAAKAAKMAANETRVMRDVNRRHSLETPDHLGRLKIHVSGKQDDANIVQEKSFSAKFKKLQEKCHKGKN